MHSILSKICNFTGLSSRRKGLQAASKQNRKGHTGLGTAQDLMESNHRFGYHAGIMFSNHRVFNHPVREVKMPSCARFETKIQTRPTHPSPGHAPPTKWKPCTFLSKKGPRGQNLWKILFWSGQSELFNILHWEHISNLNLTIFAVSTGLQPFWTMFHDISWVVKFRSTNWKKTSSPKFQNPKPPQAEMLCFQWIGRTLRPPADELMAFWVCEKLRKKKTAETETLVVGVGVVVVFLHVFFVFFFHFPPVFFSSFLMTARSTSPISKIIHGAVDSFQLGGVSPPSGSPDDFSSRGALIMASKSWMLSKESGSQAFSMLSRKDMAL